MWRPAEECGSKIRIVDDFPCAVDHNLQFSSLVSMFTFNVFPQGTQRFVRVNMKCMEIQSMPDEMFGLNYLCKRIRTVSFDVSSTCMDEKENKGIPEHSITKIETSFVY
eukprot:TRINITY_DN1148_c0_g1_i4.p2 TRINITY_DN1148_c0_g1~~TRINITY_DN1148_c0_g1_i4.p2  ORF type:complete len:109 (+),score=11.26 TRINITY_DN1148_c0_g1_i4:427-753(+)